MYLETLTVETLQGIVLACFSACSGNSVACFSGSTCRDSAMSFAGAIVAHRPFP